MGDFPWETFLKAGNQRIETQRDFICQVLSTGCSPHLSGVTIAQGLGWRWTWRVAWYSQLAEPWIGQASGELGRGDGRSSSSWFSFTSDPQLVVDWTNDLVVDSWILHYCYVLVNMFSHRCCCSLTTNHHLTANHQLIVYQRIKHHHSMSTNLKPYYC